MGDPLALPGELRVSVANDGATAIVAVEGDVDIDTGGRLREELLRLLEADVRRVVLDLAHMDFVDSTGLDILVGAQKRLRQRGGEMVLRSPRPAARKVLEITRLDTVFTIEDGAS